MLVDETGFTQAASAASADVAHAWQGWVNTELGGINGHPVEVITKDSHASAPVATQLANQLINDDKIIASVGGSDQQMDAIVTKIYTDAKVPDIGGLMLTVGPTSPYVFFVAAGPPYSQQLGIDVAASVKPKKVGAVLCTEFAACATVGEVLQKRADALGVGWGGVVQVGKADTNYTAACLTMQEKGIDYIQLLIPSDVGLRLINDCTKQGYVPAYYEPYSAAVDGVAMKEMSKTGVTFTGFTPGFPWWTNDPNAQQFRRVMEKYSDKHKVPENPTQTVAWASLELFRKAMANASDTPTKEEVLAAMNAIQGDDLGGLLPVAVSYPPGATPEPLKCAWTFTVKAGEFSGGDRICLAG